MTIARSLLALGLFSLLSACSYDYRMYGTWRFTGDSPDFGECTLKLSGEYDDVGFNETRVPIEVEPVGNSCMGNWKVNLNGWFDRGTGHFQISQGGDDLLESYELSFVGDLGENSRSAKGDVYRNLAKGYYPDKPTQSSSTFTAVRL